MTLAAIRRQILAALLRMALCAAALMPATGASENAGQGIPRIRLGMGEAELKVLGLGLIEALNAALEACMVAQSRRDKS